MKRRTLVLALVAAVTLSGMTPNVYSAGEENKEVILQLNCQLQTNQEVIVSRASTAENRLNDLHFYVFNAAGELATEADVVYMVYPEEIARKKLDWPGVEAFYKE